MLLQVNTDIDVAASLLGVIIVACQGDASGVSRQTMSVGPSMEVASTTPESTCNGMCDASSKCSLTVDLYIAGGPNGPATIREGEDLVAPLRPFAKSITVCLQSSYRGRKIRCAAPPGSRRNKRPRFPGALIVEFKM